MIAVESNLSNDFNSSERHVIAKVELYSGSTLVDTYAYDGDLIGIDIDRSGESKFFGFGVCQKVNVKLIDLNRQKDISTANSFKIYFGSGDSGTYACSHPVFNVTEVNRDENTNQLSITAYDLLEKSAARTVSELSFGDEAAAIEEDEEVTESSASYTIEEFTLACASLLGLGGVVIDGVDDASFDTFYESGANFDGAETIRDALDDVAEATQTIYYIDRDNNLVFKRLDKDGAAVFTIDKSRYITLSSQTNKRLATICNCTELGDDVQKSSTLTGSTQYVRDNSFWDLRDDIADLVDAAFEAVGEMTINQFECDWCGNPFIEIGDKLALVTKDNETVYSYMLIDTVSYSGAYKQKTQWSYEDNESETSDNPTSLGEVVKQTYARVDKANKEISLLASEVEGVNQQIASIQINTDSINQSVTDIHMEYKESIEGIQEELGLLTSKVESTMTPEEINFAIKTELQQTGVDSITTETGYKFDGEGLNISKSGSEMSTLVSEDGMKVSRNDEVMLEANNQGVTAVNLHAKTYLWIGLNSRFEDFSQQEKTRTGCFWVS